MISKSSAQGQMTLGFVHRTKPTSREAGRAAWPKQSSRVLAAENHLLIAGPNGLTRHQIAAALKIPPHSAPSVVRSLIDDGLAIETDRKRETEYGSLGAVLVHSRFASK